MADVTRKGLLQPIDVQGLLAARDMGLLGSMPTGEISSVDPSMRDQIAWWLGGVLSDDPRRQAHVAQKAGGVMDFAPGIGDAVGANQAGRDLAAGNYGSAAMNAAGLIPGGDIAGGVAKAIFGGIAAKTANKGALEVAQKLAKEGADKKAIWDATGWFKGKDDKWRFEIDDSTAKFGALPKSQGLMTHLDAYAKRAYGVDGYMKLEPNGPERKMALEYANMMDEQTRTAPTRGILDHPGLFEAYPEAGEIPMGRHRGGRLDGYQGTWDGSQIGIDEYAVDPRSTALHELQHSVQSNEGFVNGGNPEQFKDAAHWREVYDNAWTVSNRVNNLGETPREAAEYIASSSGLDPEELAYLAETYTGPELRDLMKKNDPHEMYRRLGGEVEARNVQSRMNMTADQRRATPPWETQDVPDELQIIRRR
jgi:hypothetical protein